MSTRAPSVLRQFGPMVYLPTVIFALGEGALIPLIPVIAADRGADLSLAAVVASALVVGQLCGNLPAGWAVPRWGERITMLMAASVAIVAVSGMLLAPSLVLFTVAVFLLGFCAATFGVARHTFMTTRVPLVIRARALSLLGGSFRLGVFIGPFVAAALLAIFGSDHAVFWFFFVCLTAVILVVWFGPDPEKRSPVVYRKPDPAVAVDSGRPITGGLRVVDPPTGVFRTMWRHRRMLSRLGVAAASLSALRSARQVLLPLWGVSIGLDAPTIAVVVGISGAIDFALFYLSGQVMDRFGRLWAALPAMVLMGSGFILLAFTHDVTAASVWFVIVAVVLGLGNGLSSGINMTLGADAAPKASPAPFLGSWRTLVDSGGAVAPLLVAGVAALASLPVASAVIGVIGLLGGVGFWRWIPRVQED